MSIREAIISSILSTSESGICTGWSSLDGLGEYCTSCREGAGEESAGEEGGGGKGRRPRALGEDREPLVLFLGSLYGPRELMEDPGPCVIALSRCESSMLPPIGVNGNFSGRFLAVALEIVYGAASAGKCIARASPGVISFASKSKVRFDITVLRRRERRQKRKPTTKASKTTAPAIVPTILPVFEGFDDDDSVVGWD